MKFGVDRCRPHLGAVTQFTLFSLHTSARDNDTEIRTLVGVVALTINPQIKRFVIVDNIGPVEIGTIEIDSAEL